MKPSWTSEIYQKFNERTTAYKPSTQSWTRYCQQSPTGLLTIYWRSLYKMQVEKSEELKNFLQVYSRERRCLATRRMFFFFCRLKLMVQSHPSRAENQGFSFQSEKSRPGQCNRSSEERESERRRQRKCQKQLQERRLHPLDHKRPLFIWRNMRIQA